MSATAAAAAPAASSAPVASAPVAVAVSAPSAVNAVPLLSALPTSYQSKPATARGRISLAGVFDPARVEEILNALLSTIDQQNERIIALEGHHASSTSAPVTVSSLHAQLQQSTADTQKVLMSIDARLQSVEKQCRMLTELAPKWNNAAQEQLQLASQAQLHAATAQFEATQQRMWEEFQETRRDVGVLHEVESSQHRLSEQMVAIQNLLATKVDRVEVPLLKAAADTLRESEDFRHGAQKRLDALESDLAAARRLLANKEDKEHIVQRMQKIAEQLGKKADSAWVQSDVVAPQQQIDARLTEFTTRFSDDRVMPRMQAIEGNLKETNNSMAKVETTQKALTDLFETFRAQLLNKADAGSIHDKVSMGDFESTLNELSSEISAELNRMQRTLHKTESSTSQLLSTVVALDQKTAVCLKFVDWYSDAHR